MPPFPLTLLRLVAHWATDLHAREQHIYILYVTNLLTGSLVSNIHEWRRRRSHTKSRLLWGLMSLTRTIWDLHICWQGGQRGSAWTINRLWTSISSRYDLHGLHLAPHGVSAKVRTAIDNLLHSPYNTHITVFTLLKRVHTYNKINNKTNYKNEPHPPTRDVPNATPRIMSLLLSLCPGE